MFIDNEVRHVRLGWKYSYIKGIVFSNNTRLLNMQYELNAKIPTDKELETIDKKNMRTRRRKNNAEYQY